MITTHGKVTVIALHGLLTIGIVVVRALAGVPPEIVGPRRIERCISTVLPAKVFARAWAEDL